MKRGPAGVATAALLLCGCAAVQTQPVQDTAAAFSAAVRGDRAAACELLTDSTRRALVASEQKPCPEALAELDLKPPGPVEAVSVYELQAQVVRTDGTLFLTLENGRWTVMAAGCEPQERDRPYDCELEKG